jgi:hypothetical protein
MERKVPKFMTEKLDIIRFFFIVLLGAIALIVAYRPQVVLRGLIVNSNQSLFYIISLIILGFITLITSRVLFYKTNQRKPLTFKNFCTWIILEIVSIILVLSVFAWSINEPNTRSFSTILERTTISVFSVLFIPYLVSWLYFSLREKEKEHILSVPDMDLLLHKKFKFEGRIKNLNIKLNYAAVGPAIVFTNSNYTIKEVSYAFKVGEKSIKREINNMKSIRKPSTKRSRDFIDLVKNKS